VDLKLLNILSVIHTDADNIYEQFCSGDNSQKSLVNKNTVPQKLFNNSTDIEKTLLWIIQAQYPNCGKCSQYV
jgi:hypothetical protein